MGMLRFGGGTTANVYAGFRAAYRTWLEVLGSDGGLTVPESVPARPARDAGARARRRDRAHRRRRLAGDLRARDRGFRGQRPRRRAAGRQPRRKPPHRGHPVGAARSARDRGRLARSPARPPSSGERRCILNRWKRRARRCCGGCSATGAAKAERSRAVILPGGPPFTLAFFANDEMDRVENYDTMDLALFRADEIKRSLLDDDWKED